MAELGDTQDPRMLIPGDPEEIGDGVAALRRLSARFRGINEDLDEKRAPRWSGEASTAFRAALSQQARQWRTTSDAFAEVADALAAHAEVLRRSQQKAADSITLWRQGEAATREAARSGSTTTAPRTPDPGEQHRSNAQQLLSQARSELEKSGVDVADKIASRGAGPNSRGALAAMVEAMTAPSAESTKTSAKGPSASASATAPTSSGGLGKLQASASLASASVEHTADNGFLRRSEKAQAGLGADATASASATNSGISGRAETSAGATASAEQHQDVGPVGRTTAANGFAGARAGAGVTAGPKEFSASADAFAGARGTLKEGADVGGIGVNGTAEGWAGPGAEAKATFGKGSDGKWHGGLSAGASPLVGGKLGVELTVDPAKVERTAHQASDAVGHLPSTMGQVAGSAEQKISEWAT